MRKNLFLILVVSTIMWSCADDLGVGSVPLEPNIAVNIVIGGEEGFAGLSKKSHPDDSHKNVVGGISPRLKKGLSKTTSKKLETVKVEIEEIRLTLREHGVENGEVIEDVLDASKAKSGILSSAYLDTQAPRLWVFHLQTRDKDGEIVHDQRTPFMTSPDHRINVRVYLVIKYTVHDLKLSH